MSDMEQVARRAVDCEGWRCMRGMLCLTDEDGYAARILHVSRFSYHAALPDLADPATLGCLLHLVREAWKDEGLTAVVANYDHENGYQWRVVGGHHHGSTFMAMGQKRYSTEAEALVTALEAAVALDARERVESA